MLYIAVLGTASLHKAAPTATNLNWGVVLRHFCTQFPSWSDRCIHFARGTLVWSADCKACAHSTLWAGETRLSTKENKMITFYYSVSIFIPWELLMALQVKVLPVPWMQSDWDKCSGWSGYLWWSVGSMEVFKKSSWEVKAAKLNVLILLLRKWKSADVIYPIFYYEIVIALRSRTCSGDSKSEN